jgi:rhodanese-related sulfurtransferase
MSSTAVRVVNPTRFIRCGLYSLRHNTTSSATLLNRFWRANFSLTSNVQPKRLEVPSFKPFSFIRTYTVLSSDKPATLYTYDEVKKLSQTENPDVVLVDVREPNEYADGFIPTAINIPYKSSPGALGLDEEAFQDAFGFSKPAVDKKLVFYCLGGVRSSHAEALAATFGYQK